MNPLRRDGEWARKSLFKGGFYYSGYNIRALINQNFLGPYTGWNQDITVYTKNLQIMWQKRDPWGDLSAPKATLDRSFLSSLSDLINDSERVRITNSQKNFKSTFGSAYFISKNNEIKLAKPTKKEPRKASFPWDLGLLFVQPIKMHWYCRMLNFITAKGNLMHAIYKFSLNFHAKWRFP